LEVLTSILPVDLFGEQEAMVTAIRLKNVNCWKESRGGHANILNLHRNKLPELLMHADKCIPQYFFERNFNESSLKEISGRMKIRSNPQI
jgi:hypothetical protein